MLYCKQCGNSVEAQDRFCEKCTARLDVEGSVLSATEYAFEKQGGVFNPAGLDWQPALLGYEVFGKRITDFMFRLFDEEYYTAKTFVEGKNSLSVVRFFQFPRRDLYEKVLLDFSMNHEKTTQYFAEIIAQYRQHNQYLLDIFRQHQLPTATTAFDIVFSESSGVYYLFTEMRECTPLLEYLQNHTLSVRSCAHMAIQLSSYLAELHKHEVVLGNISDINLFVNSAGELLLGTACLMQYSDIAEPKKAYLEKFIPQDAVQPEALPLQQDIYAVGMVLYRLLNGLRDPFLNLYRQQVTYQDILKAQQNRLDLQLAQPPFYAQNAIGSATAKAIAPAAARFRSIEEFSRILENSLNYLSADDLDKIAVDYDKISAGTPLFAAPITTTPEQQPIPVAEQPNVVVTREEQAEKRKTGSTHILRMFSIICFVLLILVVGLYVLEKRKDRTYQAYEGHSTIIALYYRNKGRE